MPDPDSPGPPSAPNLDRRTVLAGLAASTAGLLVPGQLLADGPATDRLGTLLPQRRLGPSGPAVTCLCLGGDHVGKASRRDAQALVEQALEEGVRFFDNAHMYSGGRAEEYYGAFLTPAYRDVAFLMTKTRATSRASALQELETSLSRMKTDHVDLWQVHALRSPSDADDRVENGVIDAMLEARAAGKVRHIGFTGHASPEALLRILQHTRRRGVSVTAAQLPVNPADPHHRSFVTQVLPRCVEAGIGVLAMKSLAFGRFFGRVTGWQRTGVSLEPIVPGVLSLEDVFGYVWSLPVSTLVSGMETVDQVVQNAAFARRSWTWDAAERQRRVDAVAAHAGPDLEFYKS